MPAGRSLKSRAMRIDRILTGVYGRSELELDDNPLDTLIETILSQNTTDKNSGRAYRNLKDAFPSWDRMLGKDPKKIAIIIRSGGLAGIKAARILDALEFINRERGALDLDFLRDMEPDEAEAWLGQMKGVGPKTRSIVLLFALGMPAFPVDTHIHRVTRRLGLIGPKTTREQAQAELATLVPREEFYNFHIAIIEHGRAVCQARKPKCNLCKISRLCDFYGRQAKAQT
jgi:endonuclease-3